MSDKVPKLDELFPFVYKGGGYFREKNAPIGVSGEMLHGREAVEYLYEKMKEMIDGPVESGGEGTRC